MTVPFETRIKDRALAVGFDLVGICGAAPGERSAAAYRRWLEAGMAGEMGYMARPDRVAHTLDPSATLTGVRSMVVVGANYGARDLPAEIGDDPARGRIAAFAWRRDYHDVLTPRLRRLGDWIDTAAGREIVRRAYVDTGPVLERDAAARAGLGFVGRNTMLIHPRWGSWLFLGVLLLEADLEADAEPSGGTCGQCTRCLTACPTDAFPAPYVLDARRCISTLTIELKGPIPRALRAGLGNRVFGCDACNDVCPYNRRFARPGDDPDLAPIADLVAPRLLDLISLDDAAFRARFRGTPIARPKRRGFLRNVCVALGNWSSPEAVPSLATALGDHEPLVRGHAAWALGRIGGRPARAALDAALRGEPDAWVRREIEAALDESQEAVKP